MSDLSPSDYGRARWAHISLAGRVLDFYGRHCLGAPKPEQIPGDNDAVKALLAERFHALPVERKPAKFSDGFGKGAKWNTQVRYFEHRLVGYVMPIVTALLCTVLVGSAGLVQKTFAGAEKWNNQRKAENAAEEAREYAAKREGLKKEWAAEVAGYSAQDCLDEATELRVRDTDEKRDRYAVLQSGCVDKTQAIVDIGKSWSITKCADFAIEGNKQINEKKGQQTWVDSLVFQQGCLSVHDQQALLKLVNPN